MKKNRNWIRLTGFYVLLFGLISPLLCSKIRANDAWKALYSGRYLHYFRKFPHHSTFSFSPVHDFVARDAFNWLGNLVLYEIHLVGGLTGLQVFRALILITTLLILHSIINYKTNASILFLFVLFSYSLDQKLHLRTSIFAIPLTVLLIWIWHRSCRYGDFYIWIFPPVIVLWSNVHGSYQFGVGILILVTVTELIKAIVLQGETEGRSLQFLLVSAITMIGVLFVKPFADQQLSSQIVSLGDAISGVVDPRTVLESLQKLFTGRFVQPGTDIATKMFLGKGGYTSALESIHLPLVQYALLITVLALLTGIFYYERIRFSHVLLFLVIVPFGVFYTRTVAFLSLAFVPLILTVIREEGNHLSKFPSVGTERLAVFSVILFVLMLTYQSIVGDYSALTGNPRLEIGQGKHDIFSDRVPEHILYNYPKKQFLNGWGEGSYLIWKWWPYKRVYVDTKAVPYTTRFLKNYDSEQALKEKFDYVILWRHRKRTEYYRNSNKWSKLVEDKAMVSYRRTIDVK